jgi:hypothetical protein
VVGRSQLLAKGNEKAGVRGENKNGIAEHGYVAPVWVNPEDAGIDIPKGQTWIGDFDLKNGKMVFSRLNLQLKLPASESLRPLS